jgi:hypothetical protein
MTTDEEYAERVARGAQLLDEKVPDWPVKVGPQPNTASGTNCVSVRATGSAEWEQSAGKLGLDIDAYTAHGFRVEDEDYEDASGTERDPYDVLNRLWRAEIVSRTQ